MYAVPPPGTMPFFDGRTRGVQGVVHTVLLFLHLHFGGSAHVEHGHAACQLGETLLELFAVVVGSRGFDLGLDLTDTGLDGRLVTRAIHDGGVVLVDGDLLRRAEVRHGGVLQLQGPSPRRSPDLP